MVGASPDAPKSRLRKERPVVNCVRRAFASQRSVLTRQPPTSDSEAESGISFRTFAVRYGSLVTRKERRIERQRRSSSNVHEENAEFFGGSDSVSKQNELLDKSIIG